MFENSTVDVNVLLLGFLELHQFRSVLFGFFLVIYILALFINVLIITLVWKTHHLHSPMYFFLCHLSLSDMISITDIVPNMLYIIWKDGGYISFAACLTQFQVYGESISIVCILLAIMSYDRYLAICKPLHYASIMDITLQNRLVFMTWLISFSVTFLVVIQMSLLNLCHNNIIDHYFCDFDPFLGQSCTEVSILKIQAFFFAGILVVPPFIFIIVTYLYVGLAILMISSSTRRQKAFYTCSSHLTVVCLFYGSLMAIYLSSSHGHLFNVNKFLSLFNTVGTPLLNPIIYCLRNVEIKKAIQQLLDIENNTNLSFSQVVIAFKGLLTYKKWKSNNNSYK